MNKITTVAMLSALIAKHMEDIKPTSAYVCAESAVKLNTLANAIVANETWQCNGFKDDSVDRYLNEISRKNPTMANSEQTRIWEQGLAAYDKSKASHVKRLGVILERAGMARSAVEYIGLYGGLKFIAHGSEFFCASK